jgi:uncharacterized protein
VKTTFLDTSYLLALVLTDDVLHERADRWRNRVTGELLTTEYVLLEFVDALSEPRLRSVAVQTVSLLRSRSAVRIVPATTVLMDEGLAFFAAHADKSWSLTDCISFLLMQRERLTDALTSDRHFEQAGFRAMLRAQPGE